MAVPNRLDSQANTQQRWRRNFQKLTAPGVANQLLTLDPDGGLGVDANGLEVTAGLQLITDNGSVTTNAITIGPGLTVKNGSSTIASIDSTGSISSSGTLTVVGSFNTDHDVIHSDGSGNLTVNSITTAAVISNTINTDTMIATGLVSGAGHAYSVRTTTTNGSIGPTDDTLIFDGTGNLTCTLLDATVYVGYQFTIISAMAHQVTLDSIESQLIGYGGSTTFVLPSGYTVVIESDGTNWQIVSFGTSSEPIASFTLASGNTSIFGWNGSTSNLVVTNGTTGTLGLFAQSPHTVLAGPTSGGSSVPTFRALVSADMPAGSVSPLTTKGDIYVYGTTNTRLPVGTDGYMLVSNSGVTDGIDWTGPGDTSLRASSGGWEVNLATSGGLQTSSGVALKFADTSLSSNAGGAYVNINANGGLSVSSGLEVNVGNGLVISSNAITFNLGSGLNIAVGRLEASVDGTSVVFNGSNQISIGPGAVFPVLSTDPGSPTAGEAWFNTTTATPKCALTTSSNGNIVTTIGAFTAGYYVSANTTPQALTGISVTLHAGFMNLAGRIIKVSGQFEMSAANAANTFQINLCINGTAVCWIASPTITTGATVVGSFTFYLVTQTAGSSGSVGVVSESYGGVNNVPAATPTQTFFLSTLTSYNLITTPLVVTFTAQASITNALDAVGIISTSFQVLF